MFSADYTEKWWSSPIAYWIIITLDLSVLQKRVLPELSTRYFGGLDALDYKVALTTGGSAPRTIYSSDSDFGAGKSDLNSGSS